MLRKNIKNLDLIIIQILSNQILFVIIIIYFKKYSSPISMILKYVVKIIILNFVNIHYTINSGLNIYLTINNYIFI